MFEKETYGKMTKMCNTLDDIRKLLLVQTEIHLTLLSGYEEDCSSENISRWGKMFKQVKEGGK